MIRLHKQVSPGNESLELEGIHIMPLGLSQRRVE